MPPRKNELKVYITITTGFLAESHGSAVSIQYAIVAQKCNESNDVSDPLQMSIEILPLAEHTAKRSIFLT